MINNKYASNEILQVDEICIRECILNQTFLWIHTQFFLHRFRLENTALNSLENIPQINGLTAELQYPTHKMKLYNRGGVSNSHKLVRGIQMKKGSQQMTKIPITIPRVTAALKVKGIHSVEIQKFYSQHYILLEKPREID